MKGEMPDAIREWVTSGRLHAALKRGGGLRPIVVSGVLSRLISKCAARKLGSPVSDLLQPSQLGVGVRGACEAISHRVRAALAHDPTPLCMQVDLVNCYNTLDRQAATHEVGEACSDIFLDCPAAIGTSH